MRAQHPRPRFYTRQSDALVACDVCILRPWAGVRCAGQLARSATAQVHFRCLLRCAPSGNMLFRTAPPRARNACSDCRVLSLWLGCAQRHFLSRCPLSRRRRTPRSKPRARRVESLEPKVRSVLRRARRRRLERRVRLSSRRTFGRALASQPSHPTTGRAPSGQRAVGPTRPNRCALEPASGARCGTLLARPNRNRSGPTSRSSITILLSPCSIAWWKTRARGVDLYSHCLCCAVPVELRVTSRADHFCCPTYG